LTCAAVFTATDGETTSSSAPVITTVGSVNWDSDASTDAISRTSDRWSAAAVRQNPGRQIAESSVRLE
jgi:hypothetical protein